MSSAGDDKGTHDVSAKVPLNAGAFTEGACVGPVLWELEHGGASGMVSSKHPLPLHQVV